MLELNVRKRMELMLALEIVAKEAGEEILTQWCERIFDTHDYKGHESSSIDAYARDKVQAALDRHCPDFEGIIRFELRPYTKALIEVEEHKPLVLIIDEIDGTTNTKRCLASNLKYRPQAIISIALGLSGSLRDLIIGTVYTLDQQESFSAFRVTDEEFLSFYNQQLMYPESIIHTKGDSRKRVLVIGYSNSHRLKKGELEQILYGQKFRVYEGCRASGMDIINQIRNHNDAYIDLRHYWSTKDERGKEKEAMLEVFDIAGILPIAEGCGLKITDAEGKSWKDYNLEDTIPLVVARPDIHQDILETIKPLVEKWKGGVKDEL